MPRSVLKDIKKSLYVALAAPAPEHNAGKDQGESEQQRDRIAEAGEDRCRIGSRRQDRVDNASGSPWQLFDDIAARIDDGADARRGGAKHGNALFRRAKARLREVLRGPPAAEPGIIRWIEDEGGAVALVDDMTGEDDLVADLESNLAPLTTQIDRPRSRTRREIEVAGRKAGHPE